MCLVRCPLRNKKIKERRAPKSRSLKKFLLSCLLSSVFGPSKTQSLGPITPKQTTRPDQFTPTCISPLSLLCLPQNHDRPPHSRSCAQRTDDSKSLPLCLVRLHASTQPPHFPPKIRFQNSAVDYFFLLPALYTPNPPLPHPTYFSWSCAARGWTCRRSRRTGTRRRWRPASRISCPARWAWR